MKRILPGSIKELHSLFNKANKKLFVVGGAVRDFLKKENPKDFDLATDATPKEVLEILNNQYRTKQQGESFLVVVVYTEDQPMGMEIATFREDLYDGKIGLTRNPGVKISTIEGDVNRRDITYNSLFYDITNDKIIDLIGGINDIENKITRFVGDPILRIQEDPLRILRILRFNARYQFSLDFNASNAILSHGHTLSMITRERVWDELQKAFKQAKNFREYLESLERFKLWNVIFPMKVLPYLIINLDFNKCIYLETYLSNLFLYDYRVNTKLLVNEFKLDHSIASKICFLNKLVFLDENNAFELYKDKMRCHCSDELIMDWVNSNNYNEIRFSVFIKYFPTTDSNDLMNQGFIGKALGDKIKELETLNFKKLVNR